jgi:ankyrin repeat protein
MVNAENDSGWTPLHMASQEGHLDVVKVLLARHPKVNAQEADGETALHLAAFYGHLGVAQVLLKNGAGLRIENKEGKVPLAWRQRNVMTTLCSY